MIFPIIELLSFLPQLVKAHWSTWGYKLRKIQGHYLNSPATPAQTCRRWATTATAARQRWLGARTRSG